MHIRDRVAGGRDQGVAATLGFAQGSFKVAQAAPAEQRLEFIADDELKMFWPRPQGHVARTGSDAGEHAGFVQGVGRGQDGDVLAGRFDTPGDVGERDVFRLGAGEHHVDGLRGKQVVEIVQGFRPLRTDRHAAVAQHADQLLGVFQMVFNQKQADDRILLCHQWHSLFFNDLST